jgi:hypothetical protein
MLHCVFSASKYLFLLVFAVSLLPQSAFSDDREPLRVSVKNGPPPCDVPPPTFDFMREEGVPFANSNMTSAAWFARQVQLKTAERNEAWEQLPVRPLKVIDFDVNPWGLHATLLEFEEQVLVLYRGTEDALDYVLNGTFYTTRKGEELGLPGWVHEGFFINFQLSWSRLFEALKESKKLGKSVVFAAHSLGGVLSQYAAWLAESEGIKVTRIYTFQSPNPGDVLFKASFEQRFLNRHSNTIYGEDVTPHIPPIVESADAFGQAVLKPFGSVLAALLKKARYGALGERFTVNSEGVRRSIPSDSIAENEAEYWNSYLQKSGGKAFPLGLNASSPFIADHDIDRVLCALARAK